MFAAQEFFLHAQETAADAPVSRWKLGISMWIAGMVGVFAAITLFVPAFLAQHPPHHPIKLPMWMVLTLLCAQTGLYLAGFVWCGVALASKVGLHAPAFEAFASGRPIGVALAPQLLPGLIGGLLAAAIPWYFTSHGLIIEIHSPSALLMAVLYGGIDEEIMMRWGLMTLFVWLGWRLSGRSPRGPSTVVVWSAIMLSAVVFGAGHLPSTYALNGHLTGTMVGSVIVAGAVFGVVAGYLYRRWGLEAAMICHGLSHLFAYAAYKLL
jgi:membrane protease YdiL (CAAX protease family)